MPVRIHMIIDSLTNGGAQTQFVRLATALVERGHKITVFTYAPLHFNRAALESMQVPLVEMKKSYRFDLSPAIEFLSHSRHEQPDINVAFLRTPCAYAELARVFSPNIPLIASERTGVSPSGPVTRDFAAAAGHIMATKIVCNSHAYNNAVIAKTPIVNRKSSVIYNGIETHLFSFGQQQLQNTFNQSKRPILTLGVLAARLSPEKGALNLIHALSELSSNDRKKIQLCWVGPVDRSTKLWKEVSDLLHQRNLIDQWQWFGESTDIKEPLSEFDALVLPSLFEGTPNALCEAMAAGLPVITTDVGDAEYIVGQSAGFVCKRDNPTALATVIQSFLRSTPVQRHNMALAAHDRARELFSMDTVVNQWESLLKAATYQA